MREGGLTALKLRLGPDRLADGSEVGLMCDINQGLPLGAALQRRHALVVDEKAAARCAC